MQPLFNGAHDPPAVSLRLTDQRWHQGGSVPFGSVVARPRAGGLVMTLESLSPAWASASPPRPPLTGVSAVLRQPVRMADVLAEVRRVIDHSRAVSARSTSLRQSISAVLSRAQRAMRRSEEVRRAVAAHEAVRHSRVT